MKKTKQSSGCQELREGDRSQCLRGPEFQFGKMEKSWMMTFHHPWMMKKWMMRVAAQQCECTEHTKLHTQK